MKLFSQRTFRRLLGVVVGFFLVAAPLAAEDAFYEIPIEKLKITAGQLPKSTPRFNRERMMIPFAVVDGKGEAYLGGAIGARNRFDRVARSRDPFRGDGAERSSFPNPSAIAIRAPKGQKVTGSLYVPKPDYTGMLRVKFVVPAEAEKQEARKNFYLTKEAHYRLFGNLNIPGGAWFRFQRYEAQRTLTGKSAKEPLDTPAPTRPRRRELTQLEDTYQIFSGGRAVSENLQLDRLIRSTKPTGPTVPINTLKGITVQEMDWTKLTKGLEPNTDPLAALIPADQHALFFPSFQALTTMMDEAAQNGTPILHLIQQRAEDTRSRERYERQLCLSIDAISRLLGGQVIQSVAFTGSDPYLRTGTDVAVLFEAKSPTVLRNFLSAKQLAAAQAYPGCQQVTGSAGGVEYTGAVSPDRTICSYLASFGDHVVVTNSLAQLERLADVSAGRAKSIASLPEYTFFRDRYQRGRADETALLIVTDATIRRWCGPKWRIATSRRTRAAAIMAHHQADNLSQLIEGRVKSGLIHTKLHVPDLGTLHATKSGITSSTYGTLGFLTPISELDLNKVTKAEAESYRRWRNGYQRYWRQFFDPIAVSFSVRDDRLSADVTVMPLIDQSDYNSYIALASGAAIESNAGDRHPGSLLHWAMAINVKSEPLQWSGNFLRSVVPNVKGSPLGWLGQSISVYVDADPFWQELAQAKDTDKFFQKECYRLPIAFHAEVSDGLKLTLFLAGLRAFIEQTAPGMTIWETLKHNDQHYVKISPSEDAPQIQPIYADGTRGGLPENLALYYAPTPRALVVTLSEDLLKRSLDRQAARKKAVADKKPLPVVAKPWLGSSLGLKIDGKALGLFEKLAGENYQAVMQARCWANLPILNEWRRRYPQQDPLKLHEKHWQATLRCPGGGQYIWNETFQTMESTVYGHPGEPQTGPPIPLPLKRVKSLDFGVSFENQGLRARVEIERTAGK